MKIKAIITGATGMVGEGVMHECLNNHHVEAVLLINRHPSGVVHPKLKELIHADLSDISAIAGQLGDYNACYFCAGVSSVGKGEEEYTRLTYHLTMGFAKALSAINPDMVFCYVSGAGTDSSETGSVMWARVKGRTENELAKLPFKKVYNFRPGFMKPTPGLKNTLKLYKYIGWLFPVIKTFWPNATSTLKEVGDAMINVTTLGYNKTIIEVPDVKRLAYPPAL
ncbi:NAD-dependent epimerase/dehydratase family protein [Mucilaginibacter sp. UR6-1]|uniref:NAD-dependent epimerase/dehydratase family protein n=1 Tax=Mucilaginibacter sp. UR6-1 TaxID=1435643 RepID=UPI001E3793F9|nr:NAD-dependent epimerase/dehydratase family protein [Mucilaginibacter sp. UR6-1]MCC8408024.1 NAD-dependent epimerase/dehydratase family protein [Mucilaginibacter sp. UR6-1]